MTKPELFETLEKLLMEHDFTFDESVDMRVIQKGTTERMLIRRQLSTCGTVDPQKLTDVINQVAEARDLGAEYTWVLRWRVR